MGSRFSQGMLDSCYVFAALLLAHCTDEQDNDVVLFHGDAEAAATSAGGDAGAAALDASLDSAGPWNGSGFVDAASSSTEADTSGEASFSAPDAGLASDAATPEGDGGAVNASKVPLPVTGTFPPVSDLIADGPYGAVIVNNTGPRNAYTLYHPAELAPGGVKNPFLTWGNGIATTPDWYELLPHLASHGFVIIASNSIAVTPEDLREGIDWLFAENVRDGSTLYDKLDTTRVASMGYSLGSNGTFKIADDPRLVTTVHISGGAFEKTDTAKLQRPAAFICGAAGGDGYFTGDVAHDNCESDFEVATVPVFYGVFREGGHLGVMLSPFMERIRKAVTGWLRFQLMQDESQRALYVGDDCGFCTDSNWTVKQKNW